MGDVVVEEDNLDRIDACTKSIQIGFGELNDVGGDQITREAILVDDQVLRRELGSSIRIGKRPPAIWHVHRDPLGKESIERGILRADVVGREGHVRRILQIAEVKGHGIDPQPHAVCIRKGAGREIAGYQPLFPIDGLTR